MRISQATGHRPQLFATSPLALQPGIHKANNLTTGHHPSTFDARKVRLGYHSSLIVLLRVVPGELSQPSTLF